jgi:diphosphomevalonate decarboxylase
MNSKIVECKKALETKDFTKLGEITEAEALNMHAVMITSEPPLIYWTPGTLTIMKLVQKWRREGLEVYFTMNTGQDIHILSESKNKEVLQKKLSDLNIIKNTIVNSPTSGARLV